ncbi:unnamed protein product [Rhizoctonia solani]|uniref:DUF7587 domain-containing protein n=1 Tax=Rhizoctonia solani TaxID=456999 RepID=A0A8H3CN40_9AGAM|nr:unnamed protein product [Rhizoctonia solani]
MYTFGARNNSAMVSKDPLPDLLPAKLLSERVASTRIVFRVFDRSSFRGYNPATGFVATGFDKNPFLDEKQLAEAHLNWGQSSVFTPWISTTRRWLWAIWEMNRRANNMNTEIRVAVIDLEACRGSAKPPVHALSALGSTSYSSYRNFANHSDEILIYGRVPPEAVISIWPFEKLSELAWLPKSIPDRILPGSPYKPVHNAISVALSNPPKTPMWKAQEEGERCAGIVIGLLQDGSKRLEGQLNRLLGQVRETRTWAGKKNSNLDNLIDSLTQEMGSLSTGSGKSNGSSNNDNVGPAPNRVQTVEDAVLLMNQGANAFQKTITRAQKDAISAIKPTDGSTAGYSESSILDAYTAVVAHYKSVNDRIAGANTGNASPFTHAFDQLLRLELSCLQAQQKCYEALIVRLARQKIEQFRSVALEFARTIPLGFLDRLDIDRLDWAMMKWSMMGTIDSWLAPLERQLEGLEDKAVPSLILQTKLGWLGNEQRYPKWWETWGIESATDGTEHTRSERYYTYLADEL